MSEKAKVVGMMPVDERVQDAARAIIDDVVEIQGASSGFGLNRAGLAALSATYRGRLGDGRAASGLSIQLRAIELVNEASERLSRNPNETLLLEWLLLRLDGLV